MFEPWDTYLKRQLPKPARGLTGRPAMFGAMSMGAPQMGGMGGMAPPASPAAGGEADNGLSIDPDMLRQLLSSGALRAGMGQGTPPPAPAADPTGVPQLPGGGGLLARLFQTLGG